MTDTIEINVMYSEPSVDYNILFANPFTFLYNKGSDSYCVYEYAGPIYVMYSWVLKHLDIMRMNFYIIIFFRNNKTCITRVNQNFGFEGANIIPEPSYSTCHKKNLSYDQCL